MEEQTKQDMDLSRAAIHQALGVLRKAQDEKRGNRSLSVAITQIETGLLWLNQAEDELK